MGVVDDAVEDGIGDGGVGDDVVPVLYIDLTGEDGGAAAVAVVENFEQIAALFGADVGKSPVIEDEQFDPREGLEQAGMTAVAAGQRECIEEAWDAMIEH